MARHDTVQTQICFEGEVRVWMSLYEYKSDYWCIDESRLNIDHNNVLSCIVVLKDI